MPELTGKPSALLAGPISLRLKVVKQTRVGIIPNPLLHEHPDRKIHTEQLVVTAQQVVLMADIVAHTLTTT